MITKVSKGNLTVDEEKLLNSTYIGTYAINYVLSMFDISFTKVYN